MADLPDNILTWQQYPNVQTPYTVIEKLYGKKKGHLSQLMSRTNMGRAWPPALRTERTMHFCMQETSAAKRKKQLNKWQIELSNGDWDTSGKDKPAPQKKKTTLKSNHKLFAEKGYEAELAKIEEILAKISEDLFNSLDCGGEDKEIATLGNTYAMVMGQYRQLKKQSHDIYAADQEYIHIDEIRKLLGKTFSDLKADLDGQIAIMVGGIREMDSVELAVNLVRDKVVEAFQTATDSAKKLL